jgi:hypothetical protein
MRLTESYSRMKTTPYILSGQSCSRILKFIGNCILDCNPRFELYYWSNRFWANCRLFPAIVRLR